MVFYLNLSDKGNKKGEKSRFIEPDYQEEASRMNRKKRNTSLDFFYINKRFRKDNL